MGGYAAIQELRRREYRRPVVALTAHAMNEERRRCLDLGFDDRLGKPLNRELLMRSLEHFAGTGKGGGRPGV